MGWIDWAVVVAAGVPTLLGLGALATTALGRARVRRLSSVEVPVRTDWPTVSLVVPACNEERDVEAAVRSMLACDYPGLEVVVVDDRSTDRTGAILDRLAADDARAHVVHVDHLPDGWLGKLNALARGVERSTGAWLLFCDADAHLGPRTLHRAVADAEARGLDLLTVLPTIESAGFVGDAAFSVSAAMVAAATRPWAIADPSSTAIAATGAFILVRRAAFDRTPGFEWLRLEVADDFGLCLMIKTHGGRCDIVNAAGEVSLRWYASFGEMARLIQKNLYAILGRFSVARMAVQAAALGWLGLFPLAALLPVSVPGLRLLAAVGWASWSAAMIAGSRWTRRPWATGLVPPVGFLAVAWLVVRSAWIGARIGGIAWRGVHYPTELLAPAQRVRF